MARCPDCGNDHGNQTFALPDGTHTHCPRLTPEFIARMAIWRAQRQASEDYYLRRMRAKSNG